MLKQSIIESLDDSTHKISKKQSKFLEVYDKQNLLQKRFSGRYWFK